MRKRHKIGQEFPFFHIHNKTDTVSKCYFGKAAGIINNEKSKKN